MNLFKLFIFILSLSYLPLYAETKSLEKITLQLQWKHQFEFAGFYAAKEKGFYENAGLDVTFVEFNETTNIVDEVVNGNAQYGLAYSSIFVEYLKGKPLIFVANFFKQSPLVLVVQEDIKSPADLKGKKVMGVSDSIHNMTLLSMLDRFNINTKDIINIPTSFNIDDFVHKKVDAMSVFTTNELYQLDQKGVKYNILDPTVYGAKYYDVNLFTTRNELIDHPNRIQKFKDASIKGWEYALAHKDEIIDLILDKYNSQNKSREALSFEAQQIEHIMLPNVYDVGSIDIDRVQIIADSFLQSGLIDDVKNRDLEAFVYGYNINQLILTDTEKKYLQQKKEITMCIDPNWMPFEMIEDSKHIGMSADYMQLISSKLGTPITIIPTTKWTESIAYAKERKCDILSLAMETPERKKFMNFTNPYLTVPLVIATTYDKFFISDINELQGKKIGLVKDYAAVEFLQYKYPKINFVEVSSLEKGLHQVAKGELFGFIDNLTTIGYQIQKRFPTKLKITGQLNEKLALGIGVRNDDAVLLSILEKAINSVGEKRKQYILNQWISVRYDHKYDYMLFWKILTPFILLALILLISQYILNQYNKKLKNEVAKKVEELRQKDEILLQKYRMADMGEMLSMIAHQWNQPLSAISSAILGIKVKLASGKFDLDDQNDQKKFLEFLERKHHSIYEYVQYLSTTTDDFRNFFNPKKKRELVLLSSPIKNALKLVRASMENNGIEIITDFKIDTEHTLYQNEVMQVILNILKNSEDNFLEKKTSNPKITITTYLDKNNGIIKICDNGGGIPEKFMNVIFDPYFSTKDEINGTGLGLYMSKTMIEDHHKGILNAKNTEDGVCFEIIFTLELSK